MTFILTLDNQTINFGFLEIKNCAESLEMSDEQLTLRNKKSYGCFAVRVVSKKYFFRCNHYLNHI